MIIPGGLRVTIAERRQEAEDIVGFDLVSSAGLPLPAFSAGAHIDVHVGDGVVRQYSLCNAPSETHRYAIAVQKDPASRGGSLRVHERFIVGVEVEISHPKNHFALAHGATRSLLFAGGIGVTPILCMAERLSAIGSDFEMHYCSRTPERTAFRNRIAAGRFAQNVHFHFDDGPPQQKLDIRSTLSAPAAGAHLYVCGPLGFMNWILESARAKGWPESQIHYEFFASDPVQRDSDEAFDIQLASSGKVVHVERNQTALQALLQAGVNVPASCEQGVCGTCVTRVLSGIPDHRDLYLTEQEQAANSQFTPCCSRAKGGRLVLDL